LGFSQAGVYAEGFVQRFSTTECAPDQQINFWNDLCSRVYSPIEIEPLDRHAFVGEMEVLHDHLLKVTRFRTAPVGMQRTPAHTRGAAQPNLTAYLRLSGKARFTVRGAPLAMKAGDFILLDGFTQFEFQAEEETAALAIGFPDHLVSAHLPHVSALVGKVMEGGQEINACATATMRAIERQAELGTPSLNLARGLLELISASCEPICELRSKSLSADRWHRRIASYVAINLKDSALTPRRVSEALGISQRYLRMLCAENGEALSQTILRLRLEECARCLLNPGWMMISITEIAHHWGFEDSSYFARRFREHFNCSPSAYRTRMRSSLC
jgi:AraC family transcriptional regulator, positive regulator of tynA and feaB